MQTQDSISVLELTRYIRFLLETDDKLQQVKVRGEISNMTKHPSGHWYFTLKDSESQISCAFFKGSRTGMGAYNPQTGDQVIVRGQISVYPQRGSYQLIVSSMAPAGEGDLFQQFIRLKNRLMEEGLFDPAHKQDLPEIPARIGVVTSMTGAVIRDICHTLRRRWPALEVIIAPARMQGEGTAASVMEALDLLETRIQPDVIIIARGGGSTEDLWGFNDEQLARRVFDCEIPVISAIGHETDFTILDFVADLRAPTPTAAAELAAPDRQEWLSALQQWERTINREMSHFTDIRRQILDEAGARIRYGMEALFQHHRHKLSLLETQLEQMDMQKILERGFALVLKNQHRISEATDLQPGDTVTLQFAKDSATATIRTSE